MVLVGAGLVAAGVARSLSEVYAAYGLGVGLGIGCSYVPVVGAVQRWFVRRRGFASGVAVSGIGVGTLVMPPLAASLISLVGWRHAYLALGAAAAVLGAASALLIENDPRDRGLSPDGDRLVPGATLRRRAACRCAKRSGRGLSSASTRRCWSLRSACSFRSCTSSRTRSTTARRSPVRCGSSARSASAAPPAASFSAAWPTGSAGRWRSCSCSRGWRLALVVWLLSAGPISLALFALGYGVCYGGFVAVLPALVMDHFGGRHVSGIIGALYTSVAFGTLVGPSAAGFAFDFSGSYALPIVASIVANAAAAGIVAAMARAPAQPA